MRVDRSYCAWRIEIFPHLHRRCNSDDVPLCPPAKEVRECFLRIRNIFEQDGHRIRSIRTDGGGEYRTKIAELCWETGIHHEETAPYTPEQNGITEWANRMIYERIRAILADTGLPKELSAEIACAVPHRSQTLALGGMTPYEALDGERPDVSYLVAIGTKAFVHVTKIRMRKLDPRNFERSEMADSINFQFGSPGQTKSGYPATSVLWEKQQGIWSKSEQWEDTMTKDRMVMPQ